MRKLFALHLEDFRLKTAGIVRRYGKELPVSRWKISCSPWKDIAKAVVKKERKVEDEDRDGRKGLDWTPILDEISDGAKLLGCSEKQLRFVILSYGEVEAYDLVQLVREQNFRDVARLSIFFTARRLRQRLLEGRG